LNSSVMHFVLDIVHLCLWRCICC